MSEVTGFSAEALALAAETRARWQALGLHGALLAENIDTGEGLGFAADRPFPLASVVKLPQTEVLCDLIARGRLDGEQPVTIRPENATSGPTGVAQFSCPVTLAVTDLMYLTMALSDNAAADALFGLVAPAQITAQLHEWGYNDLVVRHPMQALYDAVARWSDNDMRLAMKMATAATTRGGGHILEVLDVSYGNIGTPRALVTLLADIWTDAVSSPAVTARVRELLGMQFTSRRLAAELASDSIRILSKTGTFLHTRHEVGVVQTDTGDRIAVAALTESTIPAANQPEIDRAIGRAARLAVEVLRQ